MGKFEYIELESKELKTKKILRIYLPDSYNENQKYPVLYMHDGQNIFSEESSAFNMSWNVHKIVEDLVSKNKIKPLIVVGIDCNPSPDLIRLDEYSPWKCSFKFPLNLNSNRDVLDTGGLGDIYCDFLVNTVKPLIDKRYSTLSDRENTILAGSSMGGFITLYLGLKYNKVFSKLGCFSNAFFFAFEEMIDFVKNIKVDNRMSIYLDTGTRESGNANDEFTDNGYIDTNNTIVDIIKEKNDPNLQDILYIIEEGAFHNELSWERRLPNFLEWILN